MKDLNQIKKQLRRIDIQIVQEYKRKNLIPEYDEVFREIGDAIKELHDKIEETRQ